MRRGCYTCNFVCNLSCNSHALQVAEKLSCVMAFELPLALQHALMLATPSLPDGIPNAPEKCHRRLLGQTFTHNFVIIKQLYSLNSCFVLAFTLSRLNLLQKRLITEPNFNHWKKIAFEFVFSCPVRGRLGGGGGGWEYEGWMWGVGLLLS